jgi:hypothetical protein
MIDDVFLKQTKAIRALDVALGYSDVPVAKALRTLKKDRDLIHQYQIDTKQAYTEVSFWNPTSLKWLLISVSSSLFY